MSIPTSRSSNANWLLIYPDGRYVSDEERDWSEVSVYQEFDRQMLAITRDRAVSLAARIEGKWHELKAPDPEGARFFRAYHDAVRVFGRDQHPVRVRHSIGMICDFGRVVMDIDPRGFSKTRVELN